MAITRSQRKKMKLAYLNSSSSSSSSSPNFALVKCSKRSQNQKKQSPLPNSPASTKFMSVVPDDLLLEIFLRLPNGRSVIQSTTVCKRWYSLVINPYTRKLIGRFIEYHLRKQSLDSSYIPAYTNTTFLFNYAELNEGPHYQLSSKEKEPRPKHFDISFMPNWEGLTIRASSGFLLLLSRNGKHYFICNSFTRQWFALPESPLSHTIGFWESFGFALICEPVDDDDNRYRYKVVVLENCLFFPGSYEVKLAIFNSETGLWTQSNFSIPYQTGELPIEGFRGNNVNLEIAVASNGILHWLEGMEEGFCCLVVLDLLRVEFRFVPLPANEQFSRICPEGGKCKVRLGVVQGRVRLSLMQESHNEAHRGFSLKVWELDSSCFSWRLVHNVVLEDISSGGAMFFVLAFDPYDGNVLFLVRGEQFCHEKIYRYEIDQDKYKKICEFPCTEGPAKLKEYVCQEFGVLTILHPLWPTPTLPSANRCSA